MAKTPAEILAAQEPYSLLKDGRYFGLNEAAATPYVVQVSPDPTEANPLKVSVGDLFTVVVGLERSDEKKATFEPFRPLPAGVLDWERDATNTTLVEEVTHGTVGLDTDKVKFVFRAIKDGTVSIKFNYNYVAKNASTGALETKTTQTTAITQVINPASAAVAAGTAATLLVAVRLDKAKYQVGENVNVTYMFNNENMDLDKIHFVATSGLTHTGTPAKTGCLVKTVFTVNTDTPVGTVQGITVYYDKQMAKVGKLTVYDPAVATPSIFGFSLDGESTPAAAVAGGAAAGGPAVAALDGGAAAAPAAASLDDVAAAPAAASEEPAAASKSSKKSKAVAD